MIALPPTWAPLLAQEIATPSFAELTAFLEAEEAHGKRIFPERGHYFRALELTPPEAVKVVILGQDPYHGAGQAHGLSFSVTPGHRIPPSLRNIYAELAADLGLATPRHGFLESWARQGVLLLNAVLSVEEGRAASHRGKGWERFTDAVVRTVAESPEPVVFILWGSDAQKKAGFVDPSRHLVLKSVHPSPLSAYRGFLGSRPFSQANTFLEEHDRGAIDWEVPLTP